MRAEVDLGTSGGRKLVGGFDGGGITSNGGVALLDRRRPDLSEHWKHLATTNPIESTFATVRHRTIRSKGCLSNKTALALVFKLVEAAQKRWRRLEKPNQLPKVVLGVKFSNGYEVIKPTNRQPEAAA